MGVREGEERERERREAGRDGYNEGRPQPERAIERTLVDINPCTTLSTCMHTSGISIIRVFSLILTLRYAIARFEKASELFRFMPTHLKQRRGKKITQDGAEVSSITVRLRCSGYRLLALRLAVAACVQLQTTASLLHRSPTPTILIGKLCTRSTASTARKHPPRVTLNSLLEFPSAELLVPPISLFVF